MFKRLLSSLHKPIYHRRIAVLSDVIVAQLRSGDRVLDVGCGSGMLGAAILAHPRCPPDVVVQGLEKFKRGGEPIEVVAHDDGPFPFADDAFDVVILADVLHHEEHEGQLLTEASRICSRSLIIKDHKPEGLLAYRRICFLDWAANNPYGVKCLYRYHRHDQWHEIFARQHLAPTLELTSIDLYPPLFNLVFGKRLQYLAVLAKAGQPALDRDASQST